MKCPSCGSVSSTKHFCSVCGRSFGGQGPTPEVEGGVQTSLPRIGWSIIKLLFWASVSYAGWLIFNADLTDLLAGARLPYYILFNWVGLPLMLLGVAVIVISVRDSLSDIRAGLRTLGQGWYRIGLVPRFITVSVLGELGILVSGWELSVLLGMDLHVALFTGLGIVALFNAGLFYGRTGQQYPKNQENEQFFPHRAKQLPGGTQSQWLAFTILLVWTGLTLLVATLA